MDNKRSTNHPKSDAFTRRAAPAAHRYARSNADSHYQQDYDGRSYTQRASRQPAGRHVQQPTRRSGAAAAPVSDRDRYSRDAYSASRKRKGKKGRVIAIVIAIILLVGGGSAWAFYNDINNNLHNGLDANLANSLVATKAPSDPFYVMLIGTDASKDRDGDDEMGGVYRSDSMMLARIDPTDKKVTLVSLHRDTKVNLDGYGTQKLNAAYAFGGESLTVDTVSDLANVDINHYAEINFDGFKDIVDALGGIEVDVPCDIDDDDAGGSLSKGTQTLNGEQALILCRSRHAFGDLVDGDSIRAANQRLVLQAIAKKILDSDIPTIAKTVQALSQYVTTDFSVSDIIGIAQALQGIDSTQDIYTAMQPTTSLYEDDIWYEVTTEPDWTNMMKRVDQGLSPTTDTIVDDNTGVILSNSGSSSSSSDSSTSYDSSTPVEGASRSGSVSVRNGSGTDGMASTAGNLIKADGYTVETGNADNYSYTKTLILYETSDKKADAEEIARVIGGGTVMQNDGTYIQATDFLVVVGSEFAAKNGGSASSSTSTSSATASSDEDYDVETYADETYYDDTYYSDETVYYDESY